MRRSCLLIVAVLVFQIPQVPASELMQGSPPAADQLVTRANWRESPFNTWSLRNVERILPTATVDRGMGRMSELPAEPMAMDGFTFKDFSGKNRDFSAFLADGHVDALLLWQNGRLRIETYRNGQEARDRHMFFSVTKSFTGLIAELLIEEGRLDPDRLISTYIPELKGSAYEDATVRHALDMEVGIDYTEIYDDPASTIFQFHYAAGYRIPPAGMVTYPSLWQLLPTLRKKGEHGKDFHYVTANTEVLGWVIERVTGQSLADVFESRIWQHLGAERDAFYTVDPHGKAVAGGGLNATARDSMRLALMVAGKGKFNGVQIVPEAAIARISAGGTPRPSLWGNENGGSDNSYVSQWYYHHPTATLFANGVHGQTIHIAVNEDVVMVVQSSHPQADDTFFITSDDFFQAIQAYLRR
ncbi:MAG: serine hydrolase [Gammaproteobacteria bacterium]|nr:serine hydrolase [Gammaproteobacteria bacterium]